MVDGQHVFAFFECGDLIALTHDGGEVWTKSLSKEYGKFVNKFGLSGSPVQSDTSVIVLIDDEGPSYLAALSKANGSILWKTDRTSRTSWSSPAILPINGQPQVIVSSAGSVDGYDPLTGKLLWTFADVGGNTGTTPLPAGPNQFLIAASPGRSGENSEGAKKSNALMKVTPDGDGWKVEKVWMSPKRRRRGLLHLSIRDSRIGSIESAWFTASTLQRASRNTLSERNSPAGRRRCLWGSHLFLWKRWSHDGSDRRSGVQGTGRQ